MKAIATPPGEETRHEELTAEEQTDLDARDRAWADGALDRAKAAQLAAINAAMEESLAVLKSGYPDSEILSWDKQEREARAYKADNTAITPLLSRMAEVRGLTVGELSNRVIAKADAFTLAAADAVGKRQSLQAQIEAATTVAEAQEVQW